MVTAPPSPGHQRPHGPPASRRVSGEKAWRRCRVEGPWRGLAPRCPRAPTHQHRAGPPRRRGAAAAVARAWREAGAVTAGPAPPRGTTRPAAPLRPKWAPCALCRARPARHARRAPRSVPQRPQPAGRHGGQTGSPVLLYQDVAFRKFLSGQQPHNYSPLGRGLAHTLWGPANISGVYSSCGCQESPGVSEGVSPAPSATLRGACLGRVGGDAGLPTGHCWGGGLHSHLDPCP